VLKSVGDRISFAACGDLAIEIADMALYRP